MQENHIVRIREGANMQRALTTALIRITEAAKQYGVSQDELEELLLLRLVCSKATIPFELREPETQPTVKLR